MNLVPLKTVLLIPLLIMSVLFTTNAQKTAKWQSLLNGKDFKNWDIYLIPSSVATDKTPYGLNNDPHKVFTMADGAMRISGQDWGGIATKESYSNYHLRFQVKFGETRWAPRQNVLRDGGLLFHCTGAYDYGSKCWMRSIEYQIQEGELGDYYHVGAGTPVVQMSRGRAADNRETQQYDPSAAFAPQAARVYRSGNFENPHGEWTTGEVVASGADAVFIVNGFVVNRLYNIFRPDLKEKVTAGRLQFQSEGAEHYLRNIEIRSIVNKPAPKSVLVTDKKDATLRADKKQELKITNTGEAIEIIAIELMGKNIDQFIIEKPVFPIAIKRNGSLNLLASMKPGSIPGNIVKLKLETINGPVSGLEITLTSDK